MSDNRKKTIAFIFARGGSQGIPGKNLQEVNGRSLLRIAVETALEVPQITRVVVSTDDQEIASEALRAGADIPFMRPAELASNRASEWHAWQHAIAHESIGAFDVFISVPATAPLREPSDLEACLKRFEKGDVDLVVTGSKSSRSPFFNMVQLCESGAVELVSQPGGKITRRQDAPQTFDVSTVGYVSSPQHILKANGVFDGRLGLVCVPIMRALDIDNFWDLEIARFLSTRTDLLAGESHDAADCLC